MTDIYTARAPYARLPSYYPQQQQQQQQQQQHSSSSHFTNNNTSLNQLPPSPTHNDYYSAQNDNSDGAMDGPNQGDKNDATRTQSATFLTKLYTYVKLRCTLHWLAPSSYASFSYSQTTRETRISSYDTMGSKGRANHCRTARTARSPCTTQYLSPVAIRILLSPAQRMSIRFSCYAL